MKQTAFCLVAAKIAGIGLPRLRAARLSLLALLIAAALAVPAASADIIAAVDVPVGTASFCGPQQWDIALIDAATGARSSLPAGINTSADELHPSISSFGTLMTFARVDPSGGTTQIVAVNPTNGQQAPLFNVFDASTLQPTDPVLTPDGSVITGAPFVQTSTAHFAPLETLTALSNFPAGPFPHSSRTDDAVFASNGRTRHPAERSDGLLAVDAISGSGSSATGGILLDRAGALAKLGPSDGSYPAFSDPTTNVVVFERQIETQQGSLARISFRPVATFDSATSVDLPAVINAQGNDVIHPAFTPDGRYLGFMEVAHDGDFHARLFVFDTQTETLVNSGGIDLGNVVSFACKATSLWSGSGGLSLRETFQLRSTSFAFTSLSGSLSFQLASSTGVGILVQRVVGHHQLFGHVVPTLKTIGRVPFGQFSRGGHRVRWNLRVNGRRLRRGTYLITPRLVTRKGVVHELGKPRIVRIR